MKNTKLIRWCLLALALCTALVVTACSQSPEASEVAAKYTNEIAKAIIEAGWKISGAIVLAAVIRAFFNK